MYFTLLVVHSIMRWLVLAALVISIYKSLIGYLKKKPFNRYDNAIRHWTATLCHIQLTIGITLYFKSPVVQSFYHHTDTDGSLIFFGAIHIFLMIVAIIVVTIGSAVAKRKAEAIEKHKTLFITYGLALIMIFIAIPWPFSPLASRPYIRIF